MFKGVFHRVRGHCGGYETNTETRNNSELRVIRALPPTTPLSLFTGKTRHIDNSDNKTLRPVVLLEREVQDRRGPPAVVLGERAPLFD